MTSRSIIIDADPGNDDAVALLLALASPELDTLGVTTVAGNVPLALTTRSARALAEHADPTRASRPFDQDRNGIVISEGGCLFTLERMDAALERGAKI